MATNVVYFMFNDMFFYVLPPFFYIQVKFIRLLKLGFKKINKKSPRCLSEALNELFLTI